MVLLGRASNYYKNRWTGLKKEQNKTIPFHKKIKYVLSWEQNLHLHFIRKIRYKLKILKPKISHNSLPSKQLRSKTCENTIVVLYACTVNLLKHEFKFLINNDNEIKTESENMLFNILTIHEICTFKSRRCAI